jgi:hypothetical protein
LIRRNDELAANMREKEAVVGLLKRSLQAVAQAFTEASDDELNRRLNFFGEEKRPCDESTCGYWRIPTNIWAR